MTAGTFHAVARRLLAPHGPLVGLPSTFTILDAEDQAQLAAMARDAVLADLDVRPSLPKPGTIVGWASLAAEGGRELEDVVAEANPRLADRMEDPEGDRRRAMRSASGPWARWTTPTCWC